MIEIKYRQPNEEEIAMFKIAKPSASQIFWDKLWIWFMISSFFLCFFFLAFLSYDVVEWLFIMIVFIPFTFYLTKIIYRKFFDNPEWEKDDAISEKVKEIHCTCRKAAMILPSENYEVSFFIEVDDLKVLFVEDGIFYQNEFEMFPNTEFKMVIDKGKKSILSIEFLGEPFEAQRTLEPFTKEELNAENFPVPVCVIDKSLDQIIIER
jgi:hypothetical protein